VFATEVLAHSAGVRLRRRTKGGDGVVDRAALEELRRVLVGDDDDDERCVPRFDIIVSRSPCALCRRFVGRLAAMTGVRFELHYARPVEPVQEMGTRMRELVEEEEENVALVDGDLARDGGGLLPPPERQKVDGWTEADGEAQVWFETGVSAARGIEAREIVPERAAAMVSPFFSFLFFFSFSSS